MRFERERCSRDDADVNAAVSLMIMWWSDLASRSLGLRRFRLYLDSLSFRVRLSVFLSVNRKLINDLFHYLNFDDNRRI